MTEFLTRKYIFPGTEVDIVLEIDQPTGKLTRGVVKGVLIKDNFHLYGIM